MAKKKKKSEAAEHLIESLMDDLKDLSSDASYHNNVYKSDSDSNSEDLSGYDSGGTYDETHQSSDVSDLWKNLEGHIDVNASGEIEKSEFVPDEFKMDIESSYDSGSDFELPVVSDSFEGPYDGPSVGDINQSPSQIFNIAASNEDPTVALNALAQYEDKGVEDKTFNIQADQSFLQNNPVTTNFTSAETVAVDGFANAAKKQKKSEPHAKVSVGFAKPTPVHGGNVMTSIDASLAQAESLRFAQQRILELEKENEGLRSENEELASAGEIIRSRTDSMAIQINQLEREKQEAQESSQSELIILKGNLQYKDNELATYRNRIEELEARLKSDFKKIRVRERELENRLEIIRAEKAALIQSKDEYILEQKRKIDQLSQELDNYRKKCLELNKQIEANQDQVRRTERALRLALTNLESKEENLVPLKKAE